MKKFKPGSLSISLLFLLSMGCLSVFVFSVYKQKTDPQEKKQTNKIEQKSSPETFVKHEKSDDSIKEVSGLEKAPLPGQSQPNHFSMKDMILGGGENEKWKSLQPAAKRARKIELNKSFLSDRPLFAKGETISIRPFDDVNIKAKIKFVEKNVMDTVCYTAEIEKSKFGRVYFTCYDKMVLCHVTYPEKNTDYIIKYNRDTGSHYALEVDKIRSDKLAGAHPEDLGVLPPSASSDSVSDVRSPSAISAASSATIDIMVIYTSAAESWSTTNEGSINNTISNAVLKGKDAHDNSNTGITINLCHSASTTYTETGTDTDLDRITTHGDGYMDDVTLPTTGLRDTYGADFVTLFMVTSSFGGLGWALKDSSGDESIAFNLTRIQQASWTYTMIHEFGHNMGCGHSKTQWTQKGPQIWGYSAGWQWSDATSTASTGFCSVMTYENFDGISGDEYTRVAYFSNPLVTYNSNPTGDASDGDNALTLVTMRDTLAAYRASTTSAGTLEFSSASYSAAESAGTATVTVQRTGGTTGAVSVDYATSDGTASSGVDYTAASGTLNWADGESTDKTFVVTVSDDSVSESDETITLTLSNPTGTSISGTNPATLTITDNDTPGFTLSSTSFTIAEDAGTDTFTVVLDSQPASDVVLTVTSSDTGELTVDKATLTFTTVNWNTPQIVTITGVDDTGNGDASETVTLSIDDASSDDSFDSLADQTVSVSLTDDDPTAADDTATVTPSSSVVISVLANDTDPQGDTLTVNAITSAPATGNAVITDSNTTITYTAGTISGIVTLTYQVTDGNGGVAEATVTITVGNEVAYGLEFKINATDVDHPLVGTLTEFVKRAKVTAAYTDNSNPLKPKDKKATVKVITKVPAKDGSIVTFIDCEWRKNVVLYNKKDLKSNNKAGTPTSTWLGLNAISPLICSLTLKTKLADGTPVLDPLTKKLLLIPPEITSVEKWDGTALGISPLQNKSIVVIKGNFFGSKAPKVWLEDPSVIPVKKQKLKVMKIAQYKDIKEKPNRSYMDLTTGASEIRVLMPKKWWKTWVANTAYDLVVDNKVGLDTTSVTTADSSGNALPTVTPDTFTVTTGEKTALDVLANDSDAHSDDVTIVYDKSTAQGGKVSYDKRSGKLNYTSASGFTGTDTFEYTLDDGFFDSSSWPATVTVTITVTP